MKKTIIILLAFIGFVTVAFGQTGTIKMVSKKVDGPVEIMPGMTIEAGDQIELHEGLAPEGFRHIYSINSRGMVPLGYGANYEYLNIHEIRLNKKYEEYYVLVKYNSFLYIAEIDKGLKSGEIKQIIPKAN